MPIKRLTICLSIAAAVAGLSTHAAGNPLEIELTGLVNNHPQIKAAEKSLQSSRKGVDAAVADFYPVVSVTGDTGYENINSPSTRRFKPHRR